MLGKNDDEGSETDNEETNDNEEADNEEADNEETNDNEEETNSEDDDNEKDIDEEEVLEEQPEEELLEEQPEEQPQEENPNNIQKLFLLFEQIALYAGFPSEIYFEDEDDTVVKCVPIGLFTFSLNVPVTWNDGGKDEFRKGEFVFEVWGGDEYLMSVELDVSGTSYTIDGMLTLQTRLKRSKYHLL